MTRKLAILSIVVVFQWMATGCSVKRVGAPPPPPPPPETLLDSISIQESLFKGDEAVLSDQEIARILGTQLTLADRHRMAVLSLNPSYWWSEDLTSVETRNVDNLLQTLRSSPQLTEVRFLPSLLVPSKRTVPYLREAAARIQADLLFVYTTRIQTFQRDRFMKPGEVHSQCVAESVLLDVRTGIVVQTARATENIAMTRTAADVNFNETVARTESEARGKALVSLANSVVPYLAEHAR